MRQVMMLTLVAERAEESFNSCGRDPADTLKRIVAPLAGQMAL
jgi:hypothetical protein